MSSLMKVGSQEKRTECKITCDLEILRQSPVFAEADPEVLRLFAYLATRKKYRVGDEIITQGKESAEAYYLISGKAEVTTHHRGKEAVLHHLHPQAFFGELALLARFKWFFSAHPLEECEVMIISRESFQKVLEKFPEKRDKLIEKIVQLRVQRLCEQTEFMLEQIPGSYPLKGESTA